MQLNTNRRDCTIHLLPLRNTEWKKNKYEKAQLLILLIIEGRKFISNSATITHTWENYKQSHYLNLINSLFFVIFASFHSHLIYSYTQLTTPFLRVIVN